MLCRFTVKNYKSYRDEVVFDMQASKAIKEFGDSLLGGELDKQRFLPVSSIYGSNAGGKSNFLEALTLVCDMVAIPIFLLSDDGDEPRDSKLSNLPRAYPYAFDGTSAKTPSCFELYFRASEGEYRYCLEMDGAQIVLESLHRRKIGGTRTALLFERSGDSIELGSSLKRKGVSTEFNRRISYLSFLALTYDIEQVNDAASWFARAVSINYGKCYTEPNLEKLIREEDCEDIVTLLSAADINISGIDIEEDEEPDYRRVYARHTVDGKDYRLRVNMESSGSRKLMGLASLMLERLRGGSVLLVDELDAKLHPTLLRFIVLLFKNPEVNRGGAQLIFTSQDVSIMRNDVFRRDEIWFAERDEHLVSDLWALSDFHEGNGNLVSKNSAFDKQYLSGKFGAVPELLDLVM